MMDFQMIPLELKQNLYSIIYSNYLKIYLNKY